MASANFTVNSASVPPEVSVAASSTVNLALLSNTGVNTVTWSIIGNYSEAAINPTITPSGTPLGATASFVMPSGSGQSYIVQCQINGGVDSEGVVQSLYTKTALVGVPDALGNIPFAFGESFERSATHGYTEALNDLATTVGTGSDLTREPITLAAVSNITLSGLAQTIQGVAVNDTSMRIGAFGQTDGAEGGIYNPRSGAWVRASDLDSDDEAIPGMGGLIQQGTYNNGSWTLLTPDPITLGTTALSFKLEPFVDVTGEDGVALTVASGVPSLTKISDAQITNDTIAVAKLASGGAGNNGKVVGVSGGVVTLVTAATGLVTPLNEQATALTARASTQYSWLSATDDGTRTQIQPHITMPRCRVRAASTTNVVITSDTISTTFGGLSGATALKRNDVVWLGGQTTTAENGIYRVWQVVGAVASIVRLSLIDAFFAASGLYVHISEGTSKDQYWLVLGDISRTSAKSLPKANVTFASWTRVAIDEYVLPGDDTTADNGNWQPIEARARQCMHFVGGALVFDGTYRFTSKIIIWNRTRLEGAHAVNGADAAATRLIFRGCGGFFGPALGETWETITYDTGVRPRIDLRGLNCSFEQGTTDDHYGVLAHCYTYIEKCNFVNPYGTGITIDTQTTLDAGANGSSIIDVIISGAGLNGFWFKGDDTNNISLHRSRSTNHGQRDMGAREFEPTTGHPSASSPALTLNEDLRGTGPQITLSGTRSFGAGVCPLIRVEIDSVAGGTALGQATFRVSYDWDIGTSGAGATWAHSGVTTAATYALDGVATGLTLNFPVGTYATTNAQNGTIFPGMDWGLHDDAFIGASILMLETSSGLAGGIYSLSALSTYEKVYQEAGTESDVVGSLFIGGNPNFRSGGNSTRLPWARIGTDNSLNVPGLSISNSGFPAAGNVSRGVSYIRKMAALSGDTTGYALRIPTAATTIEEGWSTNDAGLDRFRTLSTHALGTNCQGFKRGVWLGTSMRMHRIARASLPATGVPLTGGSTTSFDGPYPVSSIAWTTTPGGAALLYTVAVNSGSAAYNLTWQEVANPSCDMVALATGDQTRVITDGGHFVMPASTTAGASVITLGATSALKGARMKFEIKVQAHNVTLRNGGAGTTTAQPDKVLTAGSEYVGEYKFNGTDWIGSAWVCI